MKKFILFVLLTITTSVFARNPLDLEPLSDGNGPSRPIFLNTEPSVCSLNRPQLQGLAVIFDIGVNQETAKIELERLAVISCSIRQSDAYGSQSLIKIIFTICLFF